MTPRAIRPGLYAAAALLCALLGLALQCLVVNVRYSGNWTALFCTGSKFPPPPALDAEKVYVFPNSTGYDGQMYHYVAHDPLLRTDMGRYMDSPRARYRRILLPAVAFVLAFGQQTRIDCAYIAANLLFLLWGAWWLSRYLDSFLGVHPLWAALLVLAPAALISLDRLTVDLAFTALCIGFALYVRRREDAKAYVLLALACLCRDTGFVLAAAACLSLWLDRRFAKAVAFATAGIPAAAWYWYVGLRTPAYANVDLWQLIPFKGIFGTLLQPIAYGFGGTVDAGLQWLDRLALLGFLLAVWLGVWLARRNGFGPLEAAMALWGFLGLCLPRSFWDDCYSGARIFTPLLIYVALSPPRVRWRTMAPLLMVTPRIAVQVFVPLLAAMGLPAPR